MDEAAFALLERLERDHWWFVGRRHFIERALTRVRAPRPWRVLDAGAGSGGNLAMLAGHGSVSAFETDPHAAAVARARDIGEVALGHLPDGIPFGDKAFEVIGAFDVIEHLDDPVAALRALRQRLAPGGAIVITVPAYPWLWGPHDEVHQHRRRYTRGTLRRDLEAAGLHVRYLTYINLLLLPLAVLQRLRESVFGYQPQALQVAPWLNRLLLTIWRFEDRWVPRRSLPAGLSLLAVAEVR